VRPGRRRSQRVPTAGWRQKRLLVRLAETGLAWTGQSISLHRYTIKLRGVAVADLLTCAGNRQMDAIAAVDEMLSFMRSRKPVGGVDLKALIDEGRA